jgi:hypothetical protein
LSNFLPTSACVATLATLTALFSACGGTGAPGMTPQDEPHAAPAPASMQTHEHQSDAGAARASDAPGMGMAIDLDTAIEQIRAATASFRDLEQAVAAGYSREGGRCLDNPPHGAMGYHHQNAALLDDVLELERPEILTYERTASGGYELTGVEYIVPLDAWSGDAPPQILDQPLRRAPSLGIWYLHVWVWRENPSGVFADWNPNVTCGR